MITRVDTTSTSFAAIVTGLGTVVVIVVCLLIGASTDKILSAEGAALLSLALIRRSLLRRKGVSE
jgi:hypothetical protein